MSHRIETLDLPYYAVQPAWHGLGVVKADGPLVHTDIRKALGVESWSAESTLGWIPFDPATGKAWTPSNGEAPPAGLSWQRTQARFNLRSDLRVDDPRALLSPTGVGEGYEIVQYKEIAEIAETVLGESGARYESAGTLDNGRQAWILAKNDTVNVQGDRVDPYLLIYSSHDASRAITIQPTMIRVVCWNTLSSALANDTRAIKLHHTADVRDRIGAAIQATRDAGKAIERFTDTLNSMAQTAIDDRFAAAILLAVFPDPKPTADNPRPKTGHAEKKRNEIFTLFQSAQQGADGPGMVREGRHTAYALYNAVCEHSQYLATRRNPKDSTIREKDESYFRNNLMGGTDDGVRADVLGTIQRNLNMRNAETSTGILESVGMAN